MPASDSVDCAQAGLRVRVCERMGSFVGIYDPYAFDASRTFSRLRSPSIAFSELRWPSLRYDFTARLLLEVTAIKLSQLFAIQRHDLIDVLDKCGEVEANVVLLSLERERKIVLEALKVTSRRDPTPWVTPRCTPTLR